MDEMNAIFNSLERVLNDVSIPFYKKISNQTDLMIFT